MAAALATLHVMEEERMVENAATLGRYAMDSLAAMGRNCPFVDEVRGKGLMFGIDFKRPEHSLKLKAAWDTLHTLNFGVFGQMITVPLLQDHSYPGHRWPVIVTRKSSNSCRRWNIAQSGS